MLVAGDVWEHRVPSPEAAGLVYDALIRLHEAGIASILIGLIMAAVAILLAYESKLLLVGESADAESVRSIRKLVEADPAVAHAGPPLTMHLGPEDVLLNLDVQFQDGLSTDELIQAVDRLEHNIREEHPEIRRIFIEVEMLHHRNGQPTRTPRADADGSDGSVKSARAQPRTCVRSNLTQPWSSSQWSSSGGSENGTSRNTTGSSTDA